MNCPVLVENTVMGLVCILILPILILSIPFCIIGYCIKPIIYKLDNIFIK
jgi:hypothetical protein